MHCTPAFYDAGKDKPRPCDGPPLVGLRDTWGGDVLYTESVTPRDSERPKNSTGRTPSGNDRMNRLGTDIRELLARVEGMIEGIRDTIQGHKAV